MFETYNVAVRIRMIDGLTTGLLGFSRLFGRVHGQAAAFHQQLGRIAVTAATGLGFVVLGNAMLHAFHEPMEAAARYEQQLVRLRALGNGPAISGQAQRFSESMNVFGVSRAENLQIMTDAMMVTRGNLHEAEMIAPRIARVQAVLGGLYGEGGRDTERQLMNLMRSAEFRGGLASPEAMNRELDIAMRFITASGNRITPTDLMQFMKFGGVAATSLTPDAIVALEPLLQEMGGMRLGTSMQTLYNRLQTGIGMSGVAGSELMRYGLLDPSKVELTPEGRFRRFRQGEHPLIQADLERTDFTRWLMEVMLPTARAHGASDADLQRLGIFAGGRTGGQVIGSMIRAPELAASARAAMLRSMGIDEAYSLLPTSTIAQANELHARNEDLMLELGIAALPMMNSIIRHLIPVVHAFADFAHANPAAIKALVMVIMGLGALAVFAGSIMLLSAGFSAFGIAFRLIAPALGGIVLLARWMNPWAIGITLLVGALTALYAGWAPFRNMMNGVFDFLGKLFGIADANAIGLAGIHPTPASNNPVENMLRVTAGIWLLPAFYLLTLVFRGIGFAFRLLGMGLGVLRLAVVGLASVIGWPAVGIIALVAALTVIGVWLYNHVAPFRHAVDGIIGQLQRLLDFIGLHHNSQSDGRLTGGIAGNSLLRQRGWVDADGNVTDAGRAAYANHLRTNQGAPVQVHSTLFMDGQAVAQGVTAHQARAAARPQTGASNANPRVQPAPPSAGRIR